MLSLREDQDKSGGETEGNGYKIATKQMVFLLRANINAMLNRAPDVPVFAKQEAFPQRRWVASLSISDPDRDGLDVTCVSGCPDGLRIETSRVAGRSDQELKLEWTPSRSYAKSLPQDASFRLRITDRSLAPKSVEASVSLKVREFVDVDGDGVEDASDCDTSRRTGWYNWQMLPYSYVDSDGDGYFVPKSGTVCTGAELPVKYLNRKPPYQKDDCDDSRIRFNVSCPR